MGIFDNTPIGELIRRGYAISETELFMDVVSENETRKLIVKLNTDQMKLEFKNSKGELLSSVGRPYSPYTVSEGNKKGRFKVDLYDTGDFHESFRVENVSGLGFEIKSDPIKDDGTNLLNEWGADVEGLTVESLDKLSLFLVKKYQEIILRKLTL